MTTTNKDRAQWAAEALAAFQRATGTDNEDALPDLLCDLRHWCDREKVDFIAALERGRRNHEKETTYMATFHMPAGTINEHFCGRTPEEALQKAKSHSERGCLSLEELEPDALGYCVTHIDIADADGNETATWQTDAHRLQSAAPALLAVIEQQAALIQDLVEAWETAESVPDAVRDLVEPLEHLITDALESIERWENGVLPAAISSLEQSLPALKKVIADSKGGAA